MSNNTNTNNGDIINSSTLQTKDIINRDLVLNNLINRSQNILSNFRGSVKSKLKMVDKIIDNKKRKTHHQNSLTFYRTLSLVILAILSGGLISIIIVLYHTLSKESSMQ